MDDYDLIVVGAGRSGLEAARYASSVGVRTALVERDASGGRHAHDDAIAAAFGVVASGLGAVRRLPRHGLDRHPPSFRFSRVVEWVRGISAVSGTRPLAAVDYIEGEASFLEPSVLQVGERRLRGKRIILAPGSRVERPAIDGIEGLSLATVASLAELRVLPSSVAFVGALPATVVAAQAFARLGSRVVLIDDSVERSDLLTEVAQELGSLLNRDGVEVRFGCRLERIEATGAGFELGLREVAAEPRSVHVQRVVLSPLLSPDLDSLRLDRGAVERSLAIAVDDGFKTSAKGVWAAGGATGEPCLEAQSRLQGRLAARAALGSGRVRYRREHEVRVIPTDPPIAYVGIGAEDAAERGIEAQRVQVRLAEAPGVPSFEAGSGLTVVADRGGRILGGVVVGRTAPHLIAVLALALRQEFGVEELADHAAHGGADEAPLLAAADQLRSRRQTSAWQRLTGRLPI